jgi:histone deacetylase 1/2
MGLTLLAKAGLPNCYWVDAFLTSVYLINRLPTKVLKKLSPYFVLHKTMPSYSELRTFGCACYPYLRPYENHKLAFRSKQCIFIGYSNQQKGYRCLDYSTGRVFISRHVVFDENTFPKLDRCQSSTSHTSNQFIGMSSLPLSFPLPSTVHNLNVLPVASCSELIPPTPILPEHSTLPAPDILTLPEHSTLPAPDILTLPEHSVSPTPEPALPVTSPLPTNNLQINIPTDTHSEPSPIPPREILTRSKTGKLKAKEFPGFKTLFASRHPLCVFSSIIIESEPTCFTKAVTKPEWHAAMSCEFDALMANGTLSLCPRPLNKRVVRNKWVYKIKRHPDGHVERYKARLVAKGFDQISGIDYYDTFSPVVKPTTIRLVLALAVSLNWNIKQLDVSNAFLHGILDEEVYMEQPKGYEDDNFPEHVCRLHKSLYGLKQAPRAWFQRLSQQLIEFGFLESKMDYSLFTYITDTIRIFVLVYVDDIIITGSNREAIHHFIDKLKTEFQIKDLGELSYFLGIEALRNQDGLHLRQAKYITDLLDSTGMIGAKPLNCPSSSGTKLSSATGDILHDPTAYRRIVGALQYCTITRPDIAYSVNQLCQFMHCPRDIHWKAVKRVLRYLKGTIDIGLYYVPGDITLNVYCDSDWAGNPDDRRSTTGYGVFLGHNLIS